MGIISGGGGAASQTAVVLWERTAHTVGAGSSYEAPVDTWQVYRDDIGTFDPALASLALKKGLWLCGGYVDTTNDWSTATGFVGAFVQDGGGGPQYIGTANNRSALPANGIAASIDAPPVVVSGLFLPGTDPNQISLQLNNQSNQGLVISGFLFWALKVG